MGKKTLDNIESSDYVNREFMIKHLINCKDMDNLIIKGHLLIESALNNFINKSAFVDYDISKSKFSFFDKIEISKILGLFWYDANVQNQIKLLNKLRNSIAHEIQYDSESLNKFLKTFNKNIFKTIQQPINHDEEINYENDNGEKYKLKREFLLFAIAISFLFGYLSSYSSDISISKIRENTHQQKHKN